MKYMCSIFMDIYTFNILTENISSFVFTFIYN